MGLFNIKDGKLVLGSEHKTAEAPAQVVEPVVEAPIIEVEPVAPVEEVPVLVQEETEPAEKEYKIMLKLSDGNYLQFIVPESRLKDEVNYIESLYLDDNVKLIDFDNAMVVKKHIMFWMVTEIESLDYESGDDV